MITDDRRAPFCFQTHGALDAIRSHFEGPKRTTAIAIYVALTETANRNGGASVRENFRASRKEVAERAGVSVDTLDRYVGGFAEIGLLEVERERVGSVNLANRWSLREPDRTGAPPSRTGAATPSRTDAATPSRTGAARTTRSELQEVPKEEVTALIPAKVDRRPVSPAEGSLAVAVLAEWNGQAGQKLTSRDWISKIVMRIREYPDLRVEDHAHVIATALANPWWKGPANPSVVYGSGAQFERSILAVTSPPPAEDDRRRTGPGGAPTPEEMIRRAQRLAEEGR